MAQTLPAFASMPPDDIKSYFSGNDFSSEQFAELDALPPATNHKVQTNMPPQLLKEYNSYVAQNLKNENAGDVVDVTRSQVGDQLVDSLHTMAVKRGLISAKAMRLFNEELHQAQIYDTIAPVDERFSHLNSAIERCTELYKSRQMTDDDLKAISNLMVLDTMVLDATHHYEAAQYYPSPNERFQDYLGTIIKGDKPVEQLERLAGSVNDAIISFVHTTHPVGWLSQWGKDNVKKLTHVLEGLKAETPEIPAQANWKSRVRHNGQNNHAEIAPLSQSPKAAVDELFAEWVDYARNGSTGSRKVLSPFDKATIAEEHLREVDNLEKIRAAFNDVVAQWNQALTEVMKKNPEHAQQLETLRISAERAATMYEERTWGRTADADGRPKSTAVELYRFIHDDIKDGHYKGPILDFRQNSRVHEQLASSLFQKKFYDSQYGLYDENIQNPHSRKTFDRFCIDFMKDRNAQYDKGEGKAGNGKKQWLSPSKSIFLQMSDDDQADFAKAVIKYDYDIIPDQIGKDALAVSKKYYETFKAFVEAYKSAITAGGYNPEEISYQDFKKIKKPGTDYPLFSELEKQLNAAPNGFKFDSNQATGFTLIGQSEEQSRVDRFIENTEKLDDNGDRVPLVDKEERSTLMNVMRRMSVLKAAMEECPDDNIATRYQLANFSKASDFYVMLKLMQETKLARITPGTGKVESVDIGIMPLLETVEDLRNAEKIATDLLDPAKDPDGIAISYYKARGKKLGSDKPVAEFMVGFSDSAATGGVFASRVEIFEAMRKLHDIYAEKGIEVRFLRGPGRGTDRGGTVEAGVMEDMVPNEVQKDQLIHDATIQADLPTAMAASPTYARHNIASILLGLFTNRERALTETPEQKAAMAQYETGMKWIANRTSEIFGNTVRGQADTRKFLSTVPFNANNTSRPSKRPGKSSPPSNPTPEQLRKYDEKLYDGIRMIPKEYGFEAADLPAFLIGTKQAMDEFSRKSTADLKAMGIQFEGDGKAFMRDMKEHKAFRALIEIMRSGVKNYDPAVARLLGKLTGCEDYIQKACEQIDGLGDMLDAAAGGGKFADRVKQAAMLQRPERPLVHALDKLAHVLTATIANKEVWGKTRVSDQDSYRDQYPERVNTMNNLHCCTTALAQSRPNTPELYQLPAAIGM